jgi:hypothetical protein
VVEVSIHRNDANGPSGSAGREPLTAAQLRALPALVDLMTAARVLGLGRTTAYELARAGLWPSPLLRIGRRFKVPTAPLLALLDLPDGQTSPTPAGVLRWHELGDLAGDAG